MILMDIPGVSYLGELKDEFIKARVPDKFNDNRIATQVIQGPYTPIPMYKDDGTLTQSTIFGQSSETAFDRQNAKSISRILDETHVPNLIIANTYKRNPDGTFSMELVQQRGLMNATDDQIKMANASKRGLDAVKDAGEALIKKSYIIVFEYSDILKVQNLSGAKYQSVSNTYKDKNGFICQTRAYVYLLDFNDSISSIFYNKLWTQDSDPANVKAEKRVMFDNFKFPVKYIGTFYNPLISAVQSNPVKNSYFSASQKSETELLAELVQNGIDATTFSVEKKLADFQVKSPIAMVHPLRTKVGLKEGLRIDQRFFAYESVQKKDGTVKWKKRGVVRVACKINDNQHVATGYTAAEDMTKLYQVGGRKLDVGYYLREKKDLGLGVYGGPIYSMNDKENMTYCLGVAYNASSVLQFLGVRSLKVFGEIITGVNKYPLPDVALENNRAATDFKLNVTRYNIGLSKDLYFIRGIFRLSPFFAYTIGEAKFTEDFTYNGVSYVKEASYGKIETFGAGANFSMNIIPSIQLVFHANFIGVNYKPSDNNLPSIAKSGTELGGFLRIEF